MDCKEVNNNISAYLDGEISNDLRMVMDAHLKTCSKCSNELRILKSISGSLGQWNSIELDGNFENRVFKKIRDIEYGDSIKNTAHPKVTPFPLLRLVPRFATVIIILFLLILNFKQTQKIQNEPSSNGFEEVKATISSMKFVIDNSKEEKMVAQAHFKLADAYKTNYIRDFKSAIEQYRWVADNYPDKWYASYAQVSIADCYKKIGDYGKALAEYQKTINLYPESIEAKRANIDMTNMIQALNDIKMKKMIVEQNSGSKAAERTQFEIAEIYYYTLGNYKKAVEEYGEYIKLFPGGEYVDKAQYLIGVIYQESERDFKKAKEAFLELLKMYPDSENSIRAQEKLKELKKEPVNAM